MSKRLGSFEFNRLIAGTNVTVDQETVSSTGEGGGGAPTDAEYIVLDGDDATLTDERVLTEGKGIDITDGGAGSTATVEIDENDIPYTPATLTDWDSDADPGDVDDALDQLAGRVDINEQALSSLTPPPAPVLDDIDIDTNGANGKLTWDAGDPIGGYANCVGIGSRPAVAVDGTFTDSGDRAGVIDANDDCDGELNEDVAADPDDAYPANAFGNGELGDLILEVNGATVHTVDLTSFGTGSSLNGNGSGFTSLSAATSVEFPNGDPFDAFKYRTGSWVVDASEMTNGWNYARVIHDLGGSQTETNYVDWVVDDETTATTFSSESLTGFASGSTKDLSGVTYDSGTCTATYACTVSNAYRNTFSSSGSAITHPTTTNCSVSSSSMPNSSGNEAATVVLSKTATVDVTRITDSSMVVSTRSDRTVQSDLTSSGATLAGLLIDRASSDSTDLSHTFNDESRRLKMNDDFDTDLSADWDSSQTIVDAGAAGYSNGLQVTEGSLYYAGEASVDDYSAVANGPAGNPDYSTGITGTRYSGALFSDSTATANFRLNIQGSATLVDKDATLGTGNDNVRVSLRWPTLTGWLDVLTAFIEGNFGSTSESATAVATDGCYSASLGSDQTIPTSSLGITIGTLSTANSFDKCYVRFEMGQASTARIDSISITWDAS